MKWAEATVLATEGLAVYRLDVPADLPATPGLEGGQPGQTVVFQVAGGEAQSASWQEGSAARLDLTAALGPDLALTLSDGVTAAAPGASLTYTITVVNRGPGAANGVEIRDTLSPATTFVAASDGGSAAQGEVTWPAFDLAEGQSAVRTVTAEVVSDLPADLETVINTAAVADDGAQGLDPQPADNTATDVDALDALADLRVGLSIQGGSQQVAPGQRIEYRVDLFNEGVREARGVTLHATLPEEVALLFAGDSGSESGLEITWPAVSLAAGASVSRLVAVTVDRPLASSVKSLDASAEAVFSGTDANPPDNAASLSTTVLQRPDLTVSAVDPAGAVTDAQSLAISGSVTVGLANAGNLDITAPFAVAVFEDRNGDGLFTPATDQLLGQENVNETLAAAAGTTIPVTISGAVLFRDNRIFAWADSGQAIAESDETNNLGTTAEACGRVPTPEAFSPVLELNWPRPGIVEPTVVDSASSPVVVHLTDDNGDGKMDARDVPSIVFTTANLDPPLGVYVPSLLRAIRGDTGAPIFDVPAAYVGGLFHEFSLTTVAVGDIDLDGRPEIVVPLVVGSLHTAPFSVLVAYEHNGVLKWRSAAYSTHPQGILANRDNPSIADIDRDGVPEIVVGAHVFNTDGSLRWKGTGGQAYQSILNREGSASGAISVVADLDLTGDPEIVTGKTAYRSDGSIFWQVSEDDGYPAVADFDADPFPEIVVVAKGRVRLHEHDGTLIWGPHTLPGDQPVAGGAPTVADFDGDGAPEIGVASSNFYVVYETDGTVKWQRATQDLSSGMTGSTVFDFDGDGRFEVVYRDEVYLRVYRGEDGEELARVAVNSGTLNEEPVVADADGDGNAEILVTSDHGSNETGIPGNAANAGLRVFGDAHDNWVGTRRIWNQHAYSVGNVRDDSTIPQEPGWSWLTHNTFRAQVAPGGQAFAAPDLSVSRVIADVTAYPSVRITARVGNGGDAPVRSGLPVAFYQGDPAAGGAPLGIVHLSKALQPGEYEDVSLTFTASDFNVRTVEIAADDDGAGGRRENECNEANNRATFTYDTSFLGLSLTLTDGQSSTLEGETITYTLTVFNGAGQPATGVALINPLPAYTTLVAADGGATLSAGVVQWPLFSLAPGATAARSLTVRVDDPVPTTVTEIVNQANVTDDGAHGADPTPENNTAVDRNPIAMLRADAGGPYGIDEGAPVTFDASGSRSRNGSITSYSWDLDADGAYDDATGVRVTRTYGDETSFTVAVQVKSSTNEAAVDTAPVTVRNVAPVVAAGPDRKAVRGRPLALSGVAFTDAGKADTHTATLDWGDGTGVQAGTVTEANGAGSIAGSHTYVQEGTFEVTVCVADKDGGSGCDSFAVQAGEGWVLVGTANDVVRPGCIRFTDGGWRQAGAAWYSQKLDLSGSFDKTFRVYLGNSPDGVDGMTFTLHNAATGFSAIGDAGGFLAYRRIEPSIGVEMDIFGNQGNYGDSWSFADPVENHLAVNENGTLDHRGHPAVTLPSFEDGQEHLLRVIWNGPGRTLDVHFDGVERMLYSKELIDQIFAGTPEVYWGLTGASGDGSAEQYFCETAACAPGVTPSISVGDVQVTESPFGPVTASFPVTLSCAASQEVRIEAVTTEGDAVAGSDYQPTAQTIVFPPGETSQAFEVPVLGDEISEPAEVFFVDLGQPQGGTLRYERGVGRVLEKPWLLQGDANDQVRPGCIRFTDGGWNQGGVAWGTRKVDLARSFDKTFRVYLGKDDGGVDGIAFILQNAATGAASMGPVGGYLAYGKIAPSVAVEVDTFANRQEYPGDGWAFVDPFFEHLAVNENGTLDHRGLAPVELPNVEDGKEHQLRIVWNATTRTLYVFLDGVQRLVYQKNLIEEIFAGANEVFWGLSGASGDGGNEQYFCPVASCTAGESPMLSVGNVEVRESAEGTVMAAFPVSLACIAVNEVQVGYKTTDGTAQAGSDYQQTQGTLRFLPGEISKYVEVPILGDVIQESAEQLFLDLVQAPGIVLLYGRGTGTILDGPPASPGTLRLSAAEYQVQESGGSVTVQVLREGGSYGPVSVSYATVDQTATAPADYAAASGTITFAAGDSSPKTLSIPVVDDLEVESAETFRIALFDSSGAPLGSITSAVVTIGDDEVCPSPELLVNPGGERRGSAGSIPGWTVDAGTWQRRTSDPAPAEGAAYLMAGTETPAEMHQDVSVAAFAERIQAGAQRFRFEGLVRTGAESPSDVARIVVEYLDAGRTVVLDAFDTGEIASPDEWRQVRDERPVPADTAWIRVRLEGRGFTATGNDAYFDGLSLVALRAAALTVGDAAVYEEDTGTHRALFPVRLACPVESGVEVAWSTADGTAIAGQDYRAASGTLSLAAGSTSAQVSVDVLSDEVHERHETFQVLLGPASPQVILLDPAATGTIVNDDFCARSPGFWKNHREVWPVLWIRIGVIEYDAAGMLSLLSYNGPDASHHLARQLVATELNLRVGSDPAILPVVEQAHTFLAASPPGSRPRGALKAQAEGLKNQLDAYNNSGCAQVPVIP